MSDAREDQIARLVAPVVADRGADVEYVTIRKAGRRHVVVVAVDADGGISLDDIAALTPAVSDVLDETDVMGEAPYVLEVTSPGVARPLTAPRHWRRAAGRLVKVHPTQGAELTGRIVASDDDGVTVRVDGVDRRLAYSDIDKAVVQVEFGEAGS